MNKLTLVAFAAASILTVPALAQSSKSASGSPSPAAATTSASSSSTDDQASSSGTNSPMDAKQMRQNITTELEKDGFKNVHVVADSFLVNAENKEGQKVVMIINPDSVFSMTQVGPQTGSGTSPSNVAKK
jgi:hypothetical protein